MLRVIRGFEVRVRRVSLRAALHARQSWEGKIDPHSCARTAGRPPSGVTPLPSLCGLPSPPLQAWPGARCL